MACPTLPSKLNASRLTKPVPDFETAFWKSTIGAIVVPFKVI